MVRLVQLTAAIASLASIGHALLVIPYVTTTDLDTTSPDPVNFAGALSVFIKCPKCPIATMPAFTKMDSTLQFNITLEHNGDGSDTFKLNDFTAYPINPFSDLHSMKLLTANQLIRGPSGGLEVVDSPDLGWEIVIITPIEPAGNAGNPLNLIKIRVQILEVGGKYIKGISAIEFKLLETPSGALMLGDSQIIPDPSSKPSKGCQTTLCAWKAYVKDKLSKLKNTCGVRPPVLGGAKKPAQDDTPKKAEPTPAPEKVFQSERQDKDSGFMRYLRIAVVRILIPIMLGIVFGATACVIGIITGHVAVCAWRAVFRRGERSSYARVESDATNDDDEGEDETKGFLAPPIYEQAPLYTDVASSPKTPQ